MLCKKCNNTPTVRGIKLIDCTSCGKETYINIAYNTHLCRDCSNEKVICQMCGKELKGGNINYRNNRL